MSQLCTELHIIANAKPRHRFPFNDKEISKDGIYILFEDGEIGHGRDRIVRVGTHTGDRQLRSRLKQHFVQQNKDRSIFRKNIGRCLLNNEKDPYLKIWELDLTTSQAKAQNVHLVKAEYQKGVELQVSQYIQSNFSFCVIDMPSKEVRLYIEGRMISTVSCCTECHSSSKWLGLSSPVEKIAQSGLWQVNELYKEPLSQLDIERLVSYP
ncbi:hypothetical protein [Paenibacillus sp. Soil724D2]|uniref:hypothetical protein n=1 Tax=Paenibacillus sp. (strain Soil724D2) TaxID=1736392 RepID=UPI0007147BF5|nr:hypothetical protein [Paenibacillus sp. Soil724D2]KRE50649.1 hypothetical protein ASG85_20575 [Paenibacillus sp. Soil724D2]